MTREQERLYLGYSAQRLWRARLRTGAQAPFLADIETRLVDETRRATTRRKPPDRQMALL
jgi:hypothetical protein